MVLGHGDSREGLVMIWNHRCEPVPTPLDSLQNVWVTMVGLSLPLPPRHTILKPKANPSDIWHFGLANYRVLLVHCHGIKG